MKKKSFTLPIIIAFLVLYLFSMALSTYFVKQHYQEQFNYDYTNIIINLRERFSNTSDEMLVEVANKTDCYRDYMGFLLSQTEQHLTSPKHQQYSLSIYDANGSKLAQSGNYLSVNIWDLSNYPQHTEKEFYFHLDDYLSEREIIELSEHCKSLSTTSELSIYGEIEKETKKLVSLYLVEGSSESEGIPSEPIWSWESSTTEAHTHISTYSFAAPFSRNSNIVFPYLLDGDVYYTNWWKNDFLQGHPETREFENVMKNNQTASLYEVRGETFGNFVFSNSTSIENLHWITLRSVSHPLSAAMDYLKYVYIITFLVMLACMLKVLYTAKNTYKEQYALEETRRSFTSLAAKDLEMPLEKIQTLAECLQTENGNPNNETILNQIVEQTEVIDELIQEMIKVSKSNTI